MHKVYTSVTVATIKIMIIFITRKDFLVLLEHIFNTKTGELFTYSFVNFFQFII